MPRRISSSPIGTTHEVGGASSFTCCIALWTASTSSGCMRFARASGLTPANAQISSATRGETREKSCTSDARIVRLFVDRSILSSIPSSTPYGCGFISFGSGGSSSETCS